MFKGGGDTPLKRQQNTSQMSFYSLNPSRQASINFVGTSQLTLKPFTPSLVPSKAPSLIKVYR